MPPPPQFSSLRIVPVGAQLAPEQHIPGAGATQQSLVVPKLWPQASVEPQEPEWVWLSPGQPQLVVAPKTWPQASVEPQEPEWVWLSPEQPQLVLAPKTCPQASVEPQEPEWV